MRDQKEIQLAWDVWNRINQLSDLLWDRYDEDFIKICLQEEDDQFVHTLEAPDLPGDEEEVLF
jgi:hypothetical protein